MLRSRPDYENAIVISEPDHASESLPYYAGNPLYFPRERRFSAWAHATTASRAHISLGDLLDAAIDVRRTSARPVIILFSHPDSLARDSMTLMFPFHRTLSWTRAQRDRFLESTMLVDRFHAELAKESYAVYLLR
jgi:hypothetical protein